MEFIVNEFLLERLHGNADFQWSQRVKYRKTSLVRTTIELNRDYFYIRKYIKEEDILREDENGVQMYMKQHNVWYKTNILLMNNGCQKGRSVKVSVRIKM